MVLKYTSLAIVVCVLMLRTNVLHAQNFPTDRFKDWSTAGLISDTLQSQLQVDFTDFGGNGDGVSPNDQIIAELISEIPDSGLVIFFPKGNYLFNEPISLKSKTILRGASANETKLIFDLKSASDLISATGQRASEEFEIKSIAAQDSLVITTKDTTNFTVGDWVYLFENDERLVTSNWANESTGQINQITEIAGDSLVLKEACRRSFDTLYNAKLVKIIPERQIGIEMLSIERLDQTSTQTSNINFRYAIDSWAKCVSSYKCNFAHVSLNYSSNIEITDSYFESAFDHGGGGKAYGVVLQFGSGSSLVHNNIFIDLRHSVLLQAGPNGNVISYNYSREPFWEGVLLPSDSAGDLVLHGNYPYGNLFEGNTAQQIVIDDSHGINGPDNCFFRNRLELYGIFMNNNPASDGQLFIANEITNSNFLLGNYALNGTGHYEFANNVKGDILPQVVDSLDTPSLYLNTPIESYLNIDAWPPIGFPRNLETFKIEAEKRYISSAHTACGQIMTLAKEIEDKVLEVPILYPNPVGDFLFFDDLEGLSKVEVYNMIGNKLIDSHASKKLDISNLNPGTYLILTYGELNVVNSALIYKR